MESRNNLLSIILVPFFTLTVVGCGSYFDAKDQSHPGAQKAADPAVPTHTEVNLKAMSDADVIHELMNTTWSTSHPAAATGAMKYYSTELNLSYHEVLKPLAQLVKKFAPQVCKIAGLPYQEGAYAENEYPCGTPIDGNWKSILNVNIPETYASESGFDIHMNGFNLPLYLGRSNMSGNYNEDTLDNLQDTQLYSSAILGKDISLRIRPYNSSVKLDVCLNVPGTTLTAPYIYISGHAKKNLWLFDLDLDASLHIHPGVVSFQYLRECFSTHVGFDSNTGDPFVNLLSIDVPKIVGTQMTWTDFKFANWFTNLFTNILTIFGVNVTAELSKSLQNEVVQVSQDDVQTSQWMVTVAQKTLGEKWANKINELLIGKMHEDVMPDSAVSLKTILSRQCDRLASMLSKNDPSRVQADACKAIINQVDLYVLPFKYDPEMENAGCYSHYANIAKADESTNYWWKETCRFKAGIMIGIPAQYDDAVQALAKRLFDTLQGLIDRNPDLLNAVLNTAIGQLHDEQLDGIIQNIRNGGKADVALEDVIDYIGNNPDLVKKLGL